MQRDIPMYGTNKLVNSIGISLGCDFTKGISHDYIKNVIRNVENSVTKGTAFNFKNDQEPEKVHQPTRHTCKTFM